MAVILDKDFEDTLYWDSFMIGIDFNLLKASPITIGTITASSKPVTNLSPYVIEDEKKLDYVSAFQKRPIHIVNAMNATAKSEYVFADMSNQSMKNSIICKAKDRDGKSKVIKLFRNGNIQFNGLKNSKDVDAVITASANALQTAFGVKEPIILSQPLVIMMTGSFTLGTPINVHELTMVFRENNKKINEKTTDRRGGIYKVGNVTISIFASGNVLMLGANSFKGLLDAYKDCLELISSNFDRLHMDKENLIRENKRRKIRDEVEDDVLGRLA